MEKLILAAYSGLAVTALMVFLIAAIVLERLIRKKSFGTTFLLTLSISMSWLGEFILRTWWTVWKYRVMAREPSAWMVNHGVVLFGQILMMFGGIILIKALTKEMGDIKVLLFTCFVIIYLIFFVYITR